MKVVQPPLDGQTAVLHQEEVEPPSSARADFKLFGDFIVVQFWLAAGRHQVTLVWQHLGADAAGGDAGARVWVTSFENEVAAGARRCEDCEPGFEVSADMLVCTSCPAGRSTAQTVDSEARCQPCPADTYAAVPGSAECTPCGVGMWSAEGSQQCLWRDVTGSVAQNGSARVYNVTGLELAWRTARNQYSGSFEASGGRFYVLELFDKATRPSASSEMDGPAPTDEAGFIWEVSEKYAPAGRGGTTQCVGTSSDQVLNLGSALEAIEPLGNGSGLVLHYTGGSMCGGQPRESFVTLKCDIEGDATLGPHALKEIQAGDSSRCAPVRLEWQTPHACPLCSLADYAMAVSDCSGGTRAVTYIKRSLCMGGLPVPSSTTEICGSGIAIGVWVVGGLMIVCLCCYAFYLRYKWRKTYDRYVKFQGEVRNKIGRSQVEFTID
mmetsp:Transcript_52603/g.139679  ORF Transcript_52603/g.139679 Transcript_52603/m.139679 type:complete len:437 (+) Transcript_52603:21-1331(+)